MRTLSFFLFLLSVTSCSLLSPIHGYKKALAKTTAQRWSAGAKGGGRGVTFRLNFYKLDKELVADTLWVNNQPLTTEITTVGDTTYVTSFFFTEDVERKTLANDIAYSGFLQVRIRDKKQEISVPYFSVIDSEYHP